VICNICKIATVLDPASATELLTMSHRGGERENEDEFENRHDDFPREINGLNE